MNRWRSTFFRLMTSDGQSFAQRCLQGCLWMLSGVYGIIIRLRWVSFQWKWRAVRALPAPVISVGNLVMGGTGKTPMVQRLCEICLNRGVRPAVLMRGYMPNANTQDSDASDEAAMLKEALNGRLDVITGANRYQRAQDYLQSHPLPDVFIADDAFQHQQLARRLDIVLLDARRPFGNGHLLPRGILREPMAHLRRANMVVLTHADRVSEEDRSTIVERIAGYVPRDSIFLARHRMIGLTQLSADTFIPSTELDTKRVAVLASIARVDGFLASVGETRAEVARVLEYGDHHAYQETDISDIIHALAQDDIRHVVTTHKDKVKLARFESQLTRAGLTVWVVRVRMECLEREDEWIERINSVLSH